MLGKRAEQRGIFEADQLFVELVPKDSFHGRLAALQGQLFRDEDFADFYCADNGRTSKPPSLMATALVLQAHAPRSAMRKPAPVPPTTCAGRWPWGWMPTAGLSRKARCHVSGPS